jgi:hypothetical protein
MKDVVIDYENSQEHWQKEQLREEINLENIDGKDCHRVKEELFQGIVDKSRILDVVNDKENCESVFNLETPHSTQYSRIIEKSRIDYIETWFQRIVDQEMPLDSPYTWLNFSPAHFQHA